MELSNETDYNTVLQELINDIESIITDWSDIKHVRNTIFNTIEASLSKFLNVQSNNQQNNTIRTSVILSFQNVVITNLHKKIFYFVNEKNQSKDEIFYKKCCGLSALKITPDQLGSLEDYCIPFPAAIVELSSLDMHELPEEKLNCLTTTFDLALAELKGAMVDVIALNCDNKIPMVSVSDIIPILATIIINAKPMHLISNLHYIEQFYISNLTSECLIAFKTAVRKIQIVSTDILLPKSTHVFHDISLKDIIKVSINVDNMYDHKGERFNHPKTPLERHIEHFTNKIIASTFNEIEV